MNCPRCEFSTALPTSKSTSVRSSQAGIAAKMRVASFLNMAPNAAFSGLFAAMLC